ncbi:hypothetical protein WMF26_11450 [Sorangium sp. So ce185]|uniref:hypothetical protein n=1 Tax=Sorangium sp. So ce185 TaxID=3133287 RepID=UPI003F648881
MKRVRRTAIAALLAASCATPRADAPPGSAAPPAPGTEAPREGRGRLVVCVGDSATDVVPATWALSSVARELGVPLYDVSVGSCPPIPPCFSDERGLLCRADVIAKLVRTAAYLAHQRWQGPGDAQAAFPDHAMATADIASVNTDEKIEQAIAAAMRDESGLTAEEQRLARLTRSIMWVPLTFLIGHEDFHMRGNVCGAPMEQALRRQVSTMSKLDAGETLFCKGHLELNEVLADQCGLAYVENIEKRGVPLEGADLAYAKRAGVALSTWMLLNRFRWSQPGKMVITSPAGYLRAPLRALLVGSRAAPAEDNHRACGEAAKLIVTYIQAETKRCEDAGLPWGGDVPDSVLELLPPRVALAWAGKERWDESTFSCTD